MAQYFALENSDSNKFYIVQQKEGGVVIQEAQTTEKIQVTSDDLDINNLSENLNVQEMLNVAMAESNLDQVKREKKTNLAVSENASISVCVMDAHENVVETPLAEMKQAITDESVNNIVDQLMGRAVPNAFADTAEAMTTIAPMQPAEAILTKPYQPLPLPDIDNASYGMMSESMNKKINKGVAALKEKLKKVQMKFKATKSEETIHDEIEQVDNLSEEKYSACISQADSQSTTENTLMYVDSTLNETLNLDKSPTQIESPSQSMEVKRSSELDVSSNIIESTTIIEEQSSKDIEEPSNNDINEAFKDIDEDKHMSNISDINKNNDQNNEKEIIQEKKRAINVRRSKRNTILNIQSQNVIKKTYKKKSVNNQLIKIIKIKPKKINEIPITKIEKRCSNRLANVSHSNIIKKDINVKETQKQIKIKIKKMKNIYNTDNLSTKRISKRIHSKNENVSNTESSDDEPLSTLTPNKDKDNLKKFSVYGYSNEDGKRTSKRLTLLQKDIVSILQQKEDDSFASDFTDTDLEVTENKKHTSRKFVNKMKKRRISDTMKANNIEQTTLTNNSADSEYVQLTQHPTIVKSISAYTPASLRKINLVDDVNELSPMSLTTGSKIGVNLKKMTFTVRNKIPSFTSDNFEIESPKRKVALRKSAKIVSESMLNGSDNDNKELSKVNNTLKKREQRIKRMEADNKAKSQMIRNREELTAKKEIELKAKEVELQRQISNIELRLNHIEKREQLVKELEEKSAVNNTLGDQEKTKDCTKNVNTTLDVIVNKNLLRKLVEQGPMDANNYDYFIGKLEVSDITKSSPQYEIYEKLLNAIEKQETNFIVNVTPETVMQTIHLKDKDVLTDNVF